MNDSDNALARLLSLPDLKNSGYANTATEIASQPEMWRRTGRLFYELAPEIKAFLGSSPRLLLSGAGSSHYVGMSIVPALRRVFDAAEAVPSTEIVMDPQSCFPREDFILISFARSGDSPEGNAVVELAEKLRPGRVRHIAITCNPKGGLASIVKGIGDRGLVIVLPEGTNDRGLAMTASFSSMVLAGFLLSIAYRDGPEKCVAVADSLSRTGQNIIGAFSDLAAMLSKEGFCRAFFIASRPFFGGALEAHLKVQELSGGAIVAKAEDTLGLRHGFMAAIESESLVVLYFSADPYRRLYEIDIAREIRKKKLGKKTIAISDSAEDLTNLADYIFETGNGSVVNDDYRALVAVLPGQLIGLFSSLSLGLKPDTPSPSGIINRVVSGVIIHPYPNLAEDR